MATRLGYPNHDGGKAFSKILSGSCDVTFVNDVNLPKEYTFQSWSLLSKCRVTVEALRSHFPVAGDGAIGTTGLRIFRGIFTAVFCSKLP